MDWDVKVTAYLDANKGSLRFATIDQIVKEVRLYVLYGRGGVSDEEIRKVVARWAIFNPVWLLPEALGGTDPSASGPSKPLSAAQASDLVSGVKKVVGAVADGVTFGRGGGSVNLKVTGLTAKLRNVSSSASLAISWGGTLGFKADSGPFHFSGELSRDKWELQLTLPDDDAVPNLSTLPKVFAEGERAVRTIGAVTADFPNLPDVRTIGALVKPHIAALEEAVGAVSGIPAAEKKSGKSFGFKLGSPEPAPGEQGIPKGVQATVTFTYWF